MGSMCGVHLEQCRARDVKALPLFNIISHEWSKYLHNIHIVYSDWVNPLVNMKKTLTRYEAIWLENYKTCTNFYQYNTNFSKLSITQLEFSKILKIE